VKTDLHAIAARVLIVAASCYTAYLQLFSTGSLAFRAAGDGVVIDAINVAVFFLAMVALADLLWRDILRLGLILPMVPTHWRHQFCVGLYSALSAAFAIRAFVATGSDTPAVVSVGTYYTLMAAGIAVEAAAIAYEERHACRPESTNA